MKFLSAPAQLLNLQVPLYLSLSNALLQTVLQQRVQLLSLWGQQLEQTLEALKIDLKVFINRLVDMLLRFFLRLLMLVYIGYYFLNAVSKFLSFIVSLHLLIVHNDHMGLVSRLRHY